VAGSARSNQDPGDDLGIGAVIRGFLAQPRMRRGLSLGRLARSWEEVVGAKLARETSPKSLEGGILLVAASSAAWGAQVRFLAEEVARRANETLGAEEVRSVRVMVSTAAGEDPKPLPRNGSER
jgi:predicted nucleic acid-binding Zn ribbon protein